MAADESTLMEDMQEVKRACDKFREEEERDSSARPEDNSVLSVESAKEISGILEELIEDGGSEIDFIEAYNFFHITVEEETDERLFLL